MPRNTKAIIHLDAIKANYQLACSTAPLSKQIAVIKADAYGHGAIEVAKALEPLVPAFAVAIIEEAISLRDAGIKKPILILQGINEFSELEYAVNHNIWTTVSNEVQAKLITENSLSSPLKIWVKIDTGMHRLGLNSDSLPLVFQDLKKCPWVHDELVLSTHFACASDINNPMTEQQLQQFNSEFSSLNNSSSLEASIANSAAILGFPQSRLDWNRPGIMLYGLSPFDQTHSLDSLLKPAMTFLSTVIAVRTLGKGESVGYGSRWSAEQTSTIATIAVGYADGYPRHATNGTPLMIAGQSATLVGTVSMDMITADISQCEGIKVGDEVELWGNNISADDVARSASTIGYDLITAVSQRVPRVYA